MSQAVLGIDTSNYTTSVALVSFAGEVIADRRRLLPVPIGALGLRQSEALFLHIKQWPQLIAQIPLKEHTLAAVAVSSQPRPADGSYMPVFLAGDSLGCAVAAGAQVPLFRFSHQEGHIRAAVQGLELPWINGVIAVQISGGTTDILLARLDDDGGYELEPLGTSLDLHAGQFIDRVGLHLGMAFPCGPHLDDLAGQLIGEPIDLPSATRGMDISFAGPASAAVRALDGGASRAAVAAGVFRCVANSLEKVLRRALEQHRVDGVLLCGGVAANTHVKSRLLARMPHVKFWMAPPELAGDNAVGIAWLGLESLRRGRG